MQTVIKQKRRQFLEHPVAAKRIETPSCETTDTRVIHPFPTSHKLRTAKNYRELLAEKRFANDFVDEVNRIATEKCIDTFSFDVFDTVLMRSMHSEARRFNLVAETFSSKLKRKFSTADALIARANAARAAYCFSRPAPDGTVEGTMSMIAAITCSQLGVSDRSDEYVKIELDFEKRHLQLNPLVVELIKRFPEKKIIFLSDMYLESSLIAELLKEHFGKKIAIISSADGHGSKRCGGIYHHAAARFGLCNERVLHFGDSLESDYRQAKRNGWNAYYLPISEAERAARRECHKSLNETLKASNVDLDSILSFNC